VSTDEPAGAAGADAVERRVVEIVSEITRVPVERIGRRTDLRVDLNVDSLQGLQIVAAIENDFGVTIPAEEMDMYASVDRIVETLGQLAAAPKSPRPVA